MGRERRPRKTEVVDTTCGYQGPEPETDASKELRLSLIVASKVLVIGL